MTAPPDLPPGATGVITVDLDAIADNWRALGALVTPAECGAVVKADAYGLGAIKVVPALARAGCRTFFIATPDEAEAARRFAPDARLFALDGLLPGAASVFSANDIAPVLTSLEELAVWSAEATRTGKRLPAGLQIDSGLNRLGLSEDDVRTLASAPARLDGIDLRLVMSHLACADDPAHPHNETQRSNFDRLRTLLPPTPASLAASDGLMLGARFHYDLVRPGYALYGGQAFQGGPTPVRPAVTVEARVLQVRTLSPGDPVGYSATWRAARPTRLAVISAGYADGIARALSASTEREGGVIAIHGEAAPIVGRVSMDLITADVTDIAAAIAPGDLATLVGPGLTVEAMGQAGGTIGYEVLTRLGTRFARHYVGGGG
ncbi:alanine racemase [Hyphomicrobium nitrativorans NL23]|uniref:Alanine racemase n=1 Tax=Hyphomicrobium nitrativorans NL23 TaxID=1029756 RepID=V5SDC4_9HYPH|nr:alanine racemase [Hyphomicrobium nitrativorans]AHB48866.1 alanine racemase [Hyphomicrobium nitrativorans NL23]